MEDNNVITLYKNKIQNVAFLVVTIIMLILIIVMTLFAEPGPEATRMDLIPISMMFGIFPVVFGWGFIRQINKTKIAYL